MTGNLEIVQYLVENYQAEISDPRNDVTDGEGKKKLIYDIELEPLKKQVKIYRTHCTKHCLAISHLDLTI